MKKNMGTADRTIRIIIALALGAMYYFNVVEGTLGLILLIVGIILLLTSLTGYCPLYSPAKINTAKKKDQE